VRHVVCEACGVLTVAMRCAVLLKPQALMPSLATMLQQRPATKMQVQVLAAPCNNRVQTVEEVEVVRTSTRRTSTRSRSLNPMMRTRTENED